MRTTYLPTVHVSVATTRCQYQWGRGQVPRCDVQEGKGMWCRSPDLIYLPLLPLATDRYLWKHYLPTTSFAGVILLSGTRLHSSRMHTARLLPICPSMHCAGGVCSQGGVSAPGGCLLQLDVWGCLLRGSVYPSIQWGRPLPPREQNDWQIGVKT